jgi:hypothetical protein
LRLKACPRLNDTLAGHEQVSGLADLPLAFSVDEHGGQMVDMGAAGASAVLGDDPRQFAAAASATGLMSQFAISSRVLGGGD